jgi:hypothetical protein
LAYQPDSHAVRVFIQRKAIGVEDLRDSVVHIEGDALELDRSHFGMTFLAFGLAGHFSLPPAPSRMALSALMANV